MTVQRRFVFCFVPTDSNKSLNMVHLQHGRARRACLRRQGGRAVAR
jgi:hypothetical protein